MSDVKRASHSMGWKFSHSYLELPDYCFTKLHPVAVSDPQMVIFNSTLAGELGLHLEECSHAELAQLFSGNALPEGAEPIAQAYAGHQFENFTMLGDGRAHLMGEHVTPEGVRVDVQLKGSGKTPYGRRGDGRAALGPMLREYIISEAMNALGIATTRSLAVVTTGEPVFRQTMQQGAVLTRIAASHLRVGTFEYLAAQKDIEGLKQLADYAIDRHYPQLKKSDEPYLELIMAVMDKQVELIVDWLRVGFIHGVMNTDNMTISGETIDYGPCAFMDEYDPKTVFSSIDTMGRYAYANQPHIGQWNLARLAEALLPLLHDKIEQAVNIAEEAIQSFNMSFQQAWLAMMRKKLGLFGEEKNDERLVGDFLQWMQGNQMDYTNTFRALMHDSLPEGQQYQSEAFKEWWQRWQNRLKGNNKPLAASQDMMSEHNPAYIPRNHKVHEALLAAEEESDFSKLHRLLDVLSNPYHDDSKHDQFQHLPKEYERVSATFCGT